MFNMTHRLNYWATPLYDRLPSWCFPERQLKFKAYGVGLPKTGTTSLFALFKTLYRSEHEAENRFIINKILAYAAGRISHDQFTKYIKHRDKRLNLEMDSSYFNAHFVDILVREINEAKFILTMRDCYSWLDSIINHHFWFVKHKKNYPLRKIHRKYQKLWSDFIFKAHLKHAQEEQIFADYGLYTVDGYFSYWSEHNNKVLTVVPKEQLLIVKTSELEQSIPKIEHFLEITPGTLPTRMKSKARKTEDKHNLLAKIDKDFLKEKMNTHCRELMEHYFPEVTI